MVCFCLLAAFAAGSNLCAEGAAQLFNRMSKSVKHRLSRGRWESAGFTLPRGNVETSLPPFCRQNPFYLPTSAYAEKEPKSRRNWFGLHLIARLPSFFILFSSFWSPPSLLCSPSLGKFSEQVWAWTHVLKTKNKMKTKKQTLKSPECHFHFNYAPVLHLYYCLRAYRNWLRDKRATFE